jgi:hypothetical protein
MTRVPQPLSPESKYSRFWKKGSKESWHAIYDGKYLISKMDKLVQKFENRFFWNEFPKLPLKSNPFPSVNG